MERIYADGEGKPVQVAEKMGFFGRGLFLIPVLAIVWDDEWRTVIPLPRRTS